MGVAWVWHGYVGMCMSREEIVLLTSSVGLNIPSCRPIGSSSFIPLRGGREGGREGGGEWM